MKKLFKYELSKNFYTWIIFLVILLISFILTIFNIFDIKDISYTFYYIIFFNFFKQYNDLNFLFSLPYDKDCLKKSLYNYSSFKSLILSLFLILLYSLNILLKDNNKHLLTSSNYSFILITSIIYLITLFIFFKYMNEFDFYNRVINSYHFDNKKTKRNHFLINFIIFTSFIILYTFLNNFNFYNNLKWDNYFLIYIFSFILDIIFIVYTIYLKKLNSKIFKHLEL